MKNPLTLLATFVALFAMFSLPLKAQQITYDKMPPHPRLLLTDGDLDAMRTFVREWPNARKIDGIIMDFSNKCLARKPLERKMTGRRLLGISREALKRIFYLSYAYRMKGDARYAGRAEREMLALCRFPDWNPSHFLDVGEMTMAVAIGYDWLYDFLSDESRQLIATAIQEKGLKPSENKKDAWFFTSSNNWNQVCNAGMVYGALVTYEHTPAYCKALIEKCLASNRPAQKCYEPDGGYPEGYGYWEYGTSFEVMLVAALQRALGTDGGICSQESFLRTASFYSYMVAPSNCCYNFSDSGLKADFSPCKYWFALQCGDPSIVTPDERFVSRDEFRQEPRLLPMYVLFGSNLDLKKGQLPKEPVWVNGGDSPVFIYRSGWEKADDTYFAIKGGAATVNHAHMDAGSFIYEYDGVRWAVDLGTQDYNALEQAGVNLWSMAQDSQRWQIYFIGHKSHNTLRFNDHDMNVSGKAEITAWKSKHRSKWVELDLSPVFAADAESVTRRAELDRNDLLTICDKITNGAQPSKVEWRMATRAKAEILDNRTIRLTEKGKRLLLILSDGTDGSATIWTPHQYMPVEKHDDNATLVGFTIQVPASARSEIRVRFVPV